MVDQCGEIIGFTRTVSLQTDTSASIANVLRRDLRSASLHVGRTSMDEITVLLPLQVMVQPLALRFRYHFSGDKPTNRLDKVRIFECYVLSLLTCNAARILPIQCA